MVIMWCKWLANVCVHWQIFWTIFQGISLWNRKCCSQFFIRTLISCMFWYLLSNCSASLTLQNRYMLIRLFNTESPISVLLKFVRLLQNHSILIFIVTIIFLFVCAENAQSLLAHPHEWVRLAAARLLGHIFCSLNVNKVAAAVASRHHSVSRNECGYFYRESKQRLKSLVLDLCAQLQPREVTAELVEQVHYQQCL